jgi:hypothetical protein
MGWWSESIMGGDTPFDIAGEFDDALGEKGKPKAQSVVDFINSKIGEYAGDAHLLKQCAGFIQIDRGGPFNDELRQLVLEGIDAENPEEAGWSEPDARQLALDDFRKIVVAYPDAGGNVILPDQPGLFETIFKHLNTDSG